METSGILVLNIQLLPGRPGLLPMLTFMLHYPCMSEPLLWSEDWYELGLWEPQPQQSLFPQVGWEAALYDSVSVHLVQRVHPGLVLIRHWLVHSPPLFGRKIQNWIDSRRVTIVCVSQSTSLVQRNTLSSCGLWQPWTFPLTGVQHPRLLGIIQQLGVPYHRFGSCIQQENSSWRSICMGVAIPHHCTVIVLLLCCSLRSLSPPLSYAQGWKMKGLVLWKISPSAGQSSPGIPWFKQRAHPSGSAGLEVVQF